jgi:hypothetical protein
LISYASLRNWNSSKKRSGKGAGDAWKNYRFVATITKPYDLFASSAEQIWIALFQSEYGLSVLEAGEAQRQEFLLGCICVAGEFSCDMHRGPSRYEIKDRGWNQLIGKNDIRRTNGRMSRRREQIRTAGPGSGKDDTTLLFASGKATVGIFADRKTVRRQR